MFDHLPASTRGTVESAAHFHPRPMLLLTQTQHACSQTRLYTSPSLNRSSLAFLHTLYHSTPAFFRALYPQPLVFLIKLIGSFFLQPHAGVLNHSSRRNGRRQECSITLCKLEVQWRMLDMSGGLKRLCSRWHLRFQERRAKTSPGPSTVVCMICWNGQETDSFSSGHIYMSLVFSASSGMISLVRPGLCFSLRYGPREQKIHRSEEKTCLAEHFSQYGQ